MVQISCDNCEKKKRPTDKTWLLGFDIEATAPDRISRAITFLDHWDDRRALEFGVVHLCSAACKDAYLRRSRAA